MNRVNNNEISDHLKQCARLMGLAGENAFKIRAFSKAAQIVENASVPLCQMTDEDILGMKGIGKNIYAVISNYIQKGSSEYFNQLLKNIPSGLIDLLKIPGLGASKIHSIYKQLGISSIQELEYAILENRLKDLKGFGEKSQEKIYQSIQFIKRYEDYVLLSDALSFTQEFRKQLLDLPFVDNMEPTGELRRRMEIIKEISFLVSCKEENIHLLEDYLKKMEEIMHIEIAPNNHLHLHFKSGYRIKLYLTPDEQFIEQLFIRTGSPEFIHHLQEDFKNRNIQMTPEGIYADNDHLVFHDEREFFKSLDHPFVPPELREPQHEDILVSNNLITRDDIKGILHIHSHWSDGKNSIRELADYGIQNGYEYLGITDHSKSSFYANGLSEQRIMKQHEEIDKLNCEYKGKFRILKGIECDILSDGNLDYPDDVLDSFDFIIIAVHQNLHMAPSQATKRILKAMEHPKANILAHPTGRLLLGRKGYDLFWDEIFHAAQENHLAIEINSNPHRLDMDWRIGLKASSAGIYAAINPDAHRLDGFAHMQFGINMATKANYPQPLIINSFNLKEVLSFFNKQ